MYRDNYTEELGGKNVLCFARKASLIVIGVKQCYFSDLVSENEVGQSEMSAESTKQCEGKVALVFTLFSLYSIFTIRSTIEILLIYILN